MALIDGNNQIYYYQTDVNGLPAELTKPNGDIVWSATYDQMGRVENILADEVDQPLRMQGQYYDKEIDLCYNRYRYFDPQTCSFISQDPIGLAAGENIYAYAANPWTWVDPLGLACENSSDTINPAQLDDSISPSMPPWEIIALAKSIPQLVFGLGKIATKSVAGIFTSKSVQVTSWASKGIKPDLNPGRWVMLGKPTKWNFWKSGLPGPKAYWTKKFPFFKIEKSNVDFTNSITDFVPKSNLKFPPGAEIIKAPLGQRVIK